MYPTLFFSQIQLDRNDLKRMKRKLYTVAGYLVANILFEHIADRPSVDRGIQPQLDSRASAAVVMEADYNLLPIIGFFQRIDNNIS